MFLGRECSQNDRYKKKKSRSFEERLFMLINYN